jgi:MFS family permease
MIGRFTVGLAVGISSMIVPVYLSEVAPTKIRGVVVTFYVVAISIGQLASSVIALELGRDWRLMLGLGAGPAII